MSTYHMFFFSKLSIKKHEIFQEKTAKAEVNIKTKRKMKRSFKTNLNRGHTKKQHCTTVSFNH